MSRKNNFDFIVGAVSSLTWHNANNDKNPACGAVMHVQSAVLYFDLFS